MNGPQPERFSSLLDGALLPVWRAFTSPSPRERARVRGNRLRVKRTQLPWPGTATLFLMLVLTGVGGSDAAEYELIRDPRFQRGFTLLDVQPGKRLPGGLLEGPVAQVSPVWDLAQWSSKHPLQPGPPDRLPGGILHYANAGKSVGVGKPGSSEADLSLAVNGSAEYGSRARTNGEPWVHLLLQQQIENPPSLDGIESARLHVEARLRSSKKIVTPGYTPDLHAAQFQIFFSVQNLHRGSAGYGQYFWFGIPLYDDRNRFPKAHKTRDTGGTGMFIFTPAGSDYTAQSAHDHAWITVDRELLPLMREGLAAAWSQGFLADSKVLADYRIAGMNLGWEVPGIFDVEMQLRNLSLKVRPTPAPSGKAGGVEP
jgi:hypothetical protein